MASNQNDTIAEDGDDEDNGDVVDGDEGDDLLPLPWTEESQDEDDESSSPNICDIVRFSDDGFVPSSNFRNTPPIRFAHSRIPRFGRSSDVLDVVLGTPAQAQDYLFGLAASSIAVIVVALVWAWILLYLKGMGSARAGWVSGRFKPVPPRPIMPDESKKEVVGEEGEKGTLVMVDSVKCGSLKEEEEEDKKEKKIDLSVVDESNVSELVDVDGVLESKPTIQVSPAIQEKEPSLLTIIEDFAAAWMPWVNTSTRQDLNDLDALAISFRNSKDEHLEVMPPPQSDQQHIETSVSMKDSKDRDLVAMPVPVDVSGGGSATTETTISTSAVETVPTTLLVGRVRQRDDSLLAREDSALVSNEQQRQEQQQQYEAEMKLWQRNYSRTKRMHASMKFVDIICAMAVVVGVFLMVFNGFDYLKRSIASGRASVNTAQELLVESLDIVKSFINGLKRLQDDTLALLLSLNGICPRVRERVCTLSTDFTNAACGYVSNVTLVDLWYEWQDDSEMASEVPLSSLDELGNETDDGLFSEVEDDMRNAFDIQAASSMVINAAAANALCGGLSDATNVACNGTGLIANFVAERLGRYFNKTRWLITQIESASDGLEGIYNSLESAKTMVSTFDWALTVAMTFMILTGVMALFLFCGLIFQKSSPRILRCVQYRFTFPLFTLLTAISLVFTCVFILGSIAVADTCVDGPEERLIAIASHYIGGPTRRFPSSMIYDFVRFYLSNCERQPRSMKWITDNIDEGGELISQFTRELQVLAARTSETCGSDQAGALFLAVFADTASKYVCGVTNIVRSIRELLRCSNIYPLYEEAMLETVCYAGSNAFWWIATTNFFVVCMALILITCRAAFFEVKVEEGPPCAEVGCGVVACVNV